MAYTFDDYQSESRKTAAYPSISQGYVYPTLGLVGEAGEIAEKVKKIFRDKNGAVSQETKSELEKELGDVLWYLSQICTELDLNLTEVAQQNIAKLKSRQARDKIKGDGDNR